VHVRAALPLLVLAVPPCAPPGAPAELVLDGDEVVVPLGTSRRHTDVDVWLSERGPFRFQADTYASTQVCLDDDLGAELDLPVVGTGRNSDGHTTRTVEFVAVDELRLGGATFRGLRALVDDYDMVPTSKGGSLQGIPGFALFRELLLTVDYPGERLVLRRGQLRADAPGVLPHVAPDGAPDVRLRVGGRERCTRPARSAGRTWPRP
jgi:hypothetical protein